MLRACELADGVGQQRAERRLGGPQQRAVPAQRGDLDPHLLACRGEREVELTEDGAADQRQEQPQVPAQHHDLRVEEVDQVGEPDAQPDPDLVDRRLRRPVPR